MSPIAEEGGETPTYVTPPVEPVATPVPPVLSLQKHTHVLSIDEDGTVPPSPVVTDKEIWLPTWQESHHEDVDSEPSVIDVPDFFLPEFSVYRYRMRFSKWYRTQNSFRQRHYRDDVVDARGCQPRFAPLFVLVSRVRQKWWLIHEDVNPRFAALFDFS